MTLEQTYFPLDGGTKWGKIIFISIVIIAGGAITYKLLVRHQKSKEPGARNGAKDEKLSIIEDETDISLENPTKQ
ncbi:MAG: hypothetical protein V4511_01065 [Bacteroidota bacterium]